LLTRRTAVEASGGHERDIIELQVLLLSDLPCSLLCCLIPNCLSKHCSGLGVEEGSFLQSIWCEIDDETEDFDFPCEYIQWLVRKVENQI
jgi:hypothetical protein